MTKKKLELFYKESCPYCQKVLTVLDQLGKQIALRDIADNPKNLEELLKIAGKKQVPCLMIDGNPMHESDDIISWLIQHEDWLENAPPMRRM